MAEQIAHGTGLAQHHRIRRPGEMRADDVRARIAVEKSDERRRRRDESARSDGEWYGAFAAEHIEHPGLLHDLRIAEPNAVEAGIELRMQAALHLGAIAPEHQAVATEPVGRGCDRAVAFGDVGAGIERTHQRARDAQQLHDLLVIPERPEARQAEMRIAVDHRVPFPSADLASIL